MTLRVVRALERGQVAPFVGIVVLALGVLVWFARASDQRPQAGVAIRAAGSRPVGAIELAAGASVVMAPGRAGATAASATGSRTDLEVYNPNQTMAAFTITLLRRDAEGPAPGPASFILSPGTSQRYTDIIGSVFHSRGAAAFRITTTFGSLLVRSDTYSVLEPRPGRVPAGSAQGRISPVLADGRAIAWGDPRRIAWLPDSPTLSGEVGALSPGRQPARHLDRAGTGTPTPTPTPQPTNAVDLVVYQPAGWANCLVCNYRENGPPPVTEFLVAGSASTYIYWAVSNLGTTTVTQPIVFGFSLDGVPLGQATWSNPSGLQGGHYQTFSGVTATVPTAGQHTLSITVDPDGLIGETNESNNGCGFTGSWTAAPPTPTPTPTPTQPPASGVDLVAYKLPSWASCVVCNYRQNGPPPVTESLVTGDDATYVYFAVANLGTTTVTAPIKFGFYLDATLLFTGTWDPNVLNPPGLHGSAVVYFDPITVTVPTAGQHSVSVAVDPDHQVPDDDRSNNECGFTGTWTGPSATPIPANPIAATGWIFGTLLPAIGTTYPPIDTLVSAVRSSGIPPLITQFVAGDPVHRVPVANGVSLVFGNGTVTPNGTFTGSVTLTFSNYQAGSSSFSANYNYSTTQDFTVNGQRNAITSASGLITASQSNVGTLSTAQSIVTSILDATVIGSGTNPAATESGNIHLDTSKCLQFPVSGSVNVTVGNDRYVISFNNKCDGSFDSATNPPAQSCNAGQQVAGEDTPDSRFFDMGRTSGTFQFDYETYSQEDRIQVIYQGGVIFDTGCVGADGTVHPSFSGQSSVIQVTVTPNCAGGSGTAWNYTVHCPT